MKQARILVVEDEKDVRDLMQIHLKREGHDVFGVESGEEAINSLSQARFDLAIFDWMLPGVSGLDLCKTFRGKLPILMVTARADTTDIVLGLELGADDYITKPFEIPIFLARVRALLRRSEQLQTPGKRTRFDIGNLRMDIEKHEVTCHSNRIELTRSEFRLLAALMENAGKVLSREKLVEFVQGEDVVVTDRVIDTHVFGIRKKLGACGDFVETIRGIGYRVNAD